MVLLFSSGHNRLQQLIITDECATRVQIPYLSLKTIIRFHVHMLNFLTWDIKSGQGIIMLKSPVTLAKQAPKDCNNQPWIFDPSDSFFSASRLWVFLPAAHLGIMVWVGLWGSPSSHDESRLRLANGTIIKHNPWTSVASPNHLQLFCFCLCVCWGQVIRPYTTICYIFLLYTIFEDRRGRDGRR